MTVTNDLHVDEPAAPSDGHPRWSRLAALGLAFVALGPLLMLVAGLVTGSEFDGFFAIVILAAALGAFLATRRRPLLRILAALLAFLTGMATFWTAFGLASPQSFFDFVPGVLVLPGALLAMVCCIASVVAQRRGHLSATPVGGERTGLRVAAGAVAVLALISGLLTLTGRETVDSAGADLRVAMDDFEFEPESLEAEPGATIFVENQDPFVHTFTIDGTDIDESLSPGSSAVVRLPDDLEGEIVFYCEPHTEDPDDPDEDHDMFGRLTVG